MAISIGMVTNFSISSALLPGHWVMIVTLVFVTSGKASTGVFEKTDASEDDGDQSEEYDQVFPFEGKGDDGIDKLIHCLGH
jgi:hypothetical protein